MNWQVNALKDLWTTRLSYQEIADRYGRSRSTVIALAREHNVARLNGKKGSAKTALSKEHVALGLKISLHRDTQSYSEMGEELGVSRHVVRMMELGYHDFTLTQLIKLSNIMGQNLDQLIETRNGR